MNFRFLSREAVLYLAVLLPSVVFAAEGFWAKSVGNREQMMKTGSLAGVISLSDLATIENLYALGPVSPLKGEISIYGKEVSISSIVEGKPVVSHLLNKEAIFLLYASVPQWRSFTLDKDLNSLEEVEKFIHSYIEKNNLEIELTFPFRIEGHSEQTDYHIIFKKDDAQHSKNEHQKAKHKFVLSNEEVKILGFWVKKDLIGKLTHPGSRTHLHVISKDGRTSGHVDDIRITKGAIIFLPQ